MTPIERGAINSTSAVPPEWATWIFENIVRGTEDSAIVLALTHGGFGAAVARDEIALVRDHPWTRAARPLSQPLRKLEALLAIRDTLTRLDARTAAIERRGGVSRKEFLQNYYACNRPVILQGLLDGNPAMERWTPEYLNEACGDLTVEIMSGRDDDPDYEIRSEMHRELMPFSAYIQRITRGVPGNDVYLVANNSFFDKPGFEVLRDEVPPIPEYLRPRKAKGQIFFWFGPEGTVTPFHHDLMNILMAQIRGRKRITMVSPDQTPWMYNTVGVYSEVDCENPDQVRHPLFRNVRRLTFDLHAGEILFIPVGWWHHIRALDTSMTITYTNFVFPNEFHWENS